MPCVTKERCGAPDKAAGTGALTFNPLTNTPVISMNL